MIGLLIQSTLNLSADFFADKNALIASSTVFPSLVSDITLFAEIQSGSILCLPGMGGIYDMNDTRFFKPAIDYVRTT